MGGSDPISLEITLVTAAEVATRFRGSTEPPTVRDAGFYVTERGRAGDYRIEYSDRATFHLSADGRSLCAAAANPDDPHWRRFLLDTGLGTAALVQGFEALHAGAFEGPTGVVAIAAGQTGGKSTLLAEFLRRGRALFTDDILVLADGGVVHPGPPLMNLPSAAADVGKTLAVLDGECWSAIEHATIDPRTLAAVVFLERGDEPGVRVERLPESPVPLLNCSLQSGRTAERRARRFGLFADVAATVPQFRLAAHHTVTPPELASALDATLSPCCS